MGVLSGAPKSFKMERKSEFASNLKSLIFDHLLHVCPDYSDDVLAEYITVLVCNGKNQNQARDDLEAFLGERSWDFVSWLWHLLMKYECRLTTEVSSRLKDKVSSNPSDTGSENDNIYGKFEDLQSQGNRNCDNLMHEGGEIYCSSTKACKSFDMLASEDHNRAPSNEMTRNVQSSGPSNPFANGDFFMKVPSSLGKHQPRSVYSSEEPASFLHNHPVSVLRRRPNSVVRVDPTSITHSSHGVKSEHPLKANVSKRSISSLPQPSSSHNNKPRRSVWDRLGKPLNDKPRQDEITDYCVLNKSENREEWNFQLSSSIVYPTEQIGQLSSSFSMPNDQGSRTLGEGHQIAEGHQANGNDNSKSVYHVMKTISQGPSVSNIRRKRHFGELSDKKDPGTTVGENAYNQSEEVIQASKRPELETSQTVVSQVQDVKLQLRQVEIEMAKLRSKQIKIEKVGKTTLSMDSGVVKPSNEETEPRTVLVTNVHYKATKEILSMYFRKCGAVVDVVILNDDMHPQRSAYITFESKESANKALGLSGTTFYSRTIMVSRKGDLASVLSTQMIGKRIRGHVSHFKSEVTPEIFHFPGPHFQWRRDSHTSTHSKTPSST